MLPKPPHGDLGNPDFGQQRGPNRPAWIPIALLIGTGMVLGLPLLLSKLASSAAIHPIAFSFWQSLIGGLLLVVTDRRRAGSPAIDWKHIRYFAVTGLCSIGLPNTLLFMSVQHLGAGVASIAYALPPALTYGLALFAGIERFRFGRMLGLLLGGVGAIFLVGHSADLPGSSVDPWVLTIVLAPATVAAANIYRTLKWPKAASARTLAGGTLLAAACWILPVMVGMDVAYLPGSQAADWLLGIAGLSSAVGFASAFLLQKISGPVYFSQLGYVVITFTMACGVLLFGERIGFATLLATAIMFSGLATVSANAGENRRIATGRAGGIPPCSDDRSSTMPMGLMSDDRAGT